jgi:hypothetical protein
MAPGEVQEGRGRGYDLVLYPKGGGRRPFQEGDRSAVVTNECRGDSLCGLSLEHQNRME